MSTSLVKRSLQLLEETDSQSSFPKDKKFVKKTKRNAGDIRKSIPLQIEKLRQNIAQKNQVDIQQTVKLLLKTDKNRRVTSSVDLLNKLTQKSNLVEKKSKKKNKNKSSENKNKGSVFTEEDFARLAAELGT
uniref:40S ribosomal protein S19-binding protein 1 n=1 Tax=Cacopsylla melanoneura TaxID=428564 RepID=A0A8D8X0K6_9HEMI